MIFKPLTVAALTALVFVGAGCGQIGTGVAIPADGYNADSSLTPQDIKLDSQPAAEESAVADETPAPTMAQYQFPGALAAEKIHGKQVRVETAKGVIVFELLDGEAPKTVSNFVYLAEQGYFDGLTFHRVVPGFVVQGGDPSGDGRGGPGYEFPDEPVRLDYDAGIVAMANKGPNTNGSQFFICLEDQPTLPKSYTVFGRVLSGMEVVRRIAVGDVMSKVTVEDK